MHSWSPSWLELRGCGGGESQAGAPQTRLCGRKLRLAPEALRRPRRNARGSASSAWAAHPRGLCTPLARPGTSRVGDHTQEVARVPSICGPTVHSFQPRGPVVSRACSETEPVIILELVGEPGRFGLTHYNLKPAPHVSYKPAFSWASGIGGRWMFED